MAINDWILNTNTEYERKSPKWRYIKDQYSGDVIDKVWDAAAQYTGKNAGMFNPNDHYLMPVSETKGQFRYRSSIYDFTPHMAKLFTTMVGMASAVEGKTARTYETKDSPFSIKEVMEEKVEQNIDGKGTNMEVFHKKLELDLLKFHRVVLVPEGIGESQTMRLKHIPPENLIDYDQSPGPLKWAKFKNVVDAREGPTEPERLVDEIVVMDTETVRKYRPDEDGNYQQYSESSQYEFYATVERKDRICPVIIGQLPLSQMMGWVLARKQNNIAALKSHRDMLLHVSNSSKLAGKVDDKSLEEIKEMLAENINFYAYDVDYISPSTDPIQAASEVIKEKIEEFYVTGFSEYGASASERTATEVRQDFRSGVEALLSLLAATMDEIENQYLFLFEQLAISNPAYWGQANVKRSREFQPINGPIEAKKIAEVFFSYNINLPAETEVNIISRILELMDIPYETEQLEDMAEQIQLTTAQENAFGTAIA